MKYNTRDKWISAQLKRYIVREYLRLILKNFAIYFFIISFLVIFNLFKTTSHLTNIIIFIILSIHFLINLSAKSLKLLKIGRLRLLLRIEEELNIPDNLLTNNETLVESDIRKILLKREAKYHNRIIPININKEFKLFALSFIVLAIITAIMPTNTLKVIRYTLLSPHKIYTQTIDSIVEINITVDPPQYTGLKPYSVTGLKELTIPIGSNLTIRLKSIITPTKAKLVSTIREIPLTVKDHLLSANIVLKEGGKFSIYEFSDGRWLKDKNIITLIAKPDHPPKISILQPKGSVTVKINQPLTFKYSATDDYGISQIKVLLKNNKHTQEIPIEVSQTKKRISGSWVFNGEQLKFSPGDTIFVSFLVKDNNQFNGPSKSISSPIKVEIFSILKYHHKVLKRAEAILNTLVDALDYTIRKFHFKEKVNPNIWSRFKTQLSTRITLLVQLMNKDPYITPDIVQMYNKLKIFIKTAPDPDNFSPSFLSRLEKWIIKLDNILREQRLEEIKLYQEQIAFLKNKLSDLISRYKENPSDELLKEIKNVTEELEKKISEMEQYVAELSPQKLPDQFINSDAYRNITSSKLKREIAQLKKALEKGQRTQIVKNAENLLAKLNLLNQQLNSAEEKYSNTLQTPFAAIDRLKRELEFISREHKKFISQIDKENLKIKKNFQKKNKQEIKKISKQISQSLSPYRFIPYVQGLLKQLNSAVKDSDLNTFKRIISKLKNFALINKHSIEKWNQELNKLQQLTRMPAKQAHFFQQINLRFQRRIKEIKQEIETLNTKFPGSTGDTNKLLQLTVRSLNNANTHYSTGESTRAEEFEKEGQHWLEEAIRSLNKSQQSLQQRKQLLSGSKPYLKRRMREEGNGPGSYPREESVKIPGRSHNISSRRKKIINEIKGGFPQPFKKLNKDYFNELME